MALDAVAEIALRDRAFYAQSGGVTFSGGEPLAQWAAVRELADQLRTDGVHIAIDTAGFAPRAVIEAVPHHIDLVLVDLKLVTPSLHHRWTGVDNAGILDAIRWWSQVMPRRLWLSLPLIPGVQDETEMVKIAGFISALRPIPPVRLIPFHRLGESKYAALGLPVPQFVGDVAALQHTAHRILADKGIFCE